jgi:Nif-specific regulatory protein
LKGGSRIQIEDLFFQPEEADSDSGLSLKEAVKWYKARYIRRVLASHGGNQTKTAQALQIQRTYLLKLIKELKIR